MTYTDTYTYTVYVSDLVGSGYGLDTAERALEHYLQQHVTTRGRFVEDVLSDDITGGSLMSGGTLTRTITYTYSLD